MRRFVALVPILIFLLGAMPVWAAKTAFRINAMYWRDPHLFVNFIGCRDVTDTPLAGFSFNGDTNTSIQTDGNGDGLLDLNYIIVFDPLDQAAASGPVTFMSGVLCSAPVWQSACWPGPPPLLNPSTYFNPGITCVDILPATVAHSYTPAITLPSAPCFNSFYTIMTLNMGGIPLTLHNVALGATYSGNPANGLVNGLIRGFVSESEANSTILPASMPLVGGQPLSILFPGGDPPGPALNCASWSDKDLLDLNPGFPGWYVYLNFTAVKVPWLENYPVPVRDGAPALALDPPHPNPFNPSTEIRYVLPAASQVEIVIYDATGRMVRTLGDEVQPRGEHSVRWDGRDITGATVSSGVYFVKLNANGETRTQKVVLLK
ncbi:MAG TPA: FlgD immunoglobulin-like domain containing protein [Candidatus Krumholzibacteria bacterium]|nr:FlgD immunoglobulin-like domain containing protein [Candidatus Krumholzibacteria bacterium]